MRAAPQPEPAHNPRLRGSESPEPTLAQHDERRRRASQIARSGRLSLAATQELKPRRRSQKAHHLAATQELKPPRRSHKTHHRNLWRPFLRRTIASLQLVRSVGSSTWTCGKHRTRPVVRMKVPERADLRYSRLGRTTSGQNTSPLATFRTLSISGEDASCHRNKMMAG